MRHQRNLLYFRKATKMIISHLKFQLILILQKV